MTTKDMIIQQLNDKLDVAVSQEKAEIVKTIFVQPKEESEEVEDDNTEAE